MLLGGRKTDMQDGQGGHLARAPAVARRLQSYLQALERMNVKLHDVISSLTGASGLAVIRAIRTASAIPSGC